MPFDLENKITWKELAPSLQSLFKSLQQQITKNAEDIENLMNRVDDLEDRMDDAEDRITNCETNIKYLLSIAQNATITGEQDGYPILITTINMEDGKQLVQENFAVRHDTLKRCEGGKTPEGSFLVTFPEPVDRVIGLQMNDTWNAYSADGGRGIGYIDGDNWVNSGTMSGSGCYISYDSVHEVNDPHTFLFFFTLWGYKLTGDAPELPGTGGNIPSEGVGGGDTTDDKINDIQNLINTLVPIGSIRYAYSIPENWIELNGQTLNRSDYEDLYNYAVNNGLIITDSSWSSNNQGKFSYGNGSTTFRVPDMRGKFVRSLDNGAGIDSGRVLGTYQLDAIQQDAFDSNSSSGGGGFYVDCLGGARAWGSFSSVKTGESYENDEYKHQLQYTYQVTFNGGGVSLGPNARLGAQTRPNNIALRIIMRAK